MSTYIPMTWPVVDLEAVCLLQNLTAPGPLILNGTLINSNIPAQISFIAANLTRSVSITSVNNLSGATFTISGFQNDAFVTENITGPNATTVYGTKYYDIITSVIVSSAVTQVSVGTGSQGYLPLIPFSTISTTVNYSCSIYLSAGSGVTYSILQTLEQVTTNFITFKDQEGTNFFPISSNQTISQILNFTAITNYLLVKIVSSTNPTTDTLKFIFLQQ